MTPNIDYHQAEKAQEAIRTQCITERIVLWTGLMATIGNPDMVMAVFISSIQAKKREELTKIMVKQTAEEISLLDAQTGGRFTGTQLKFIAALGEFFKHNPTIIFKMGKE